MLLTLYASVANAEPADYTSCQYIQDTKLFLECVEEPEFTDQYVEVPSYDNVQADYNQQVEQTIQENLDADQ
jgi:citrate lyase synthetase